MHQIISSIFFLFKSNSHKLFIGLALRSSNWALIDQCERCVFMSLFIALNVTMLKAIHNIILDSFILCLFRYFSFCFCLFLTLAGDFQCIVNDLTYQFACVIACVRLGCFSILVIARVTLSLQRRQTIIKAFFFTTVNRKRSRKTLTIYFGSTINVTVTVTDNVMRM